MSIGHVINALLANLDPQQQETFRHQREQHHAALRRLHGRNIPPSALQQGEAELIAQLTTGRQGLLTDPIATAALIHEERTAEQAAGLRSRDAARRRVAAEQLTTTGHGPFEPERLDNLLETEDEDVDYRIDGALPIGGRALLAAQYKAGKTTLVCNLTRSLVDDEDFLGRFKVEPPERVLIIDNEMDQRTQKRWLRAQGIKNTDRVDVLSLRGRVGAFNILDDETRAEWARMCEGADFVIFDCLRPVLDALGPDEHKDAGRFLVAFDAFLREVGADDAVLVHHMGHSGERARGDSRILDWPDAIWKLTREDPEDPNSPRYFSAFGRDVDIPEGLLVFDGQTRHLTLAEGSRKERTAEAAALEVLQHVQMLNRNTREPSGREIVDDLRASNTTQPKNLLEEGVRHAVKQGWLSWRLGPKGAHLHSIQPPGLAALEAQLPSAPE